MLRLLRSAAPPAALAVALSGCSVRDAFDPESGLRISIEDPQQRLGPAPWTVSVFNPYLGPERSLAERAGGTTAPGAPLVVLRRSDQDVWSVMDLMPRDGVEFGFVLPALTGEGYWLARFDRPDPMRANEPGASRQPRSGRARFCRWGRIVPEEGAESLAVEAREVETDYGLQLAVTVRVASRPAPAAGQGR